MYDIEKREILEKIKKEDEEKSADNLKQRGPATICMQCNKNKPTGFYPFWHIYRRTLCEECGEKYTSFLKQLGCWEQ